jgi:hypothetical protein
MIKIKLDFNTPALQMDGVTPFKDTIVKNGINVEADEVLMLNKLIGNNLGMSTLKGDLYKLTDWAKALYSGEILELDASDTKKLREIVINEFDFSRWTKRQICNIIDAAKQEAMDPAD